MGVDMETEENISQKRLHVHSLPLLLVAVAVTIVSLASATSSSWQGRPFMTAILRPAWRFEATDRGYVEVIPNRRLPDEPAGASVEVEADATNNGVMHVSQSIDSLGLQMALDAAAK
jgi:hypothetical protein